MSNYVLIENIYILKCKQIFNYTGMLQHHIISDLYSNQSNKH